MSMIERIRNRRDASRRARAIERALRSASSPAVRDEILAIAQRHMH
ncbi:hypothetical protein ACN26Z_02830 [Verrucosispora sp. WMMD703]|uniref:Uncharacterized protein n=2 Tax=Micromonospora TaxID=1873 RepID=A0A9W5URC6_9ACTN|nr:MULTISPECIES: hypothetical protein [Micromonospora]MBQ1050448.1 hypothetical protein [Micromonospora sp. C51]WBB55877.1 hypothetical protein O7601_07310 [Verrucosispora sp. WMMD573]WFE45594.1 hypothetical protein O7624_15155 [Verrucosispora sp. WMMD1129]SFD44890.1 hypothetical protein SAMN05216284_1179 [Micromonospora sediminimaris]GIJ08605.1 hypothetical protein Van01_18190 [Micromonospora andamanensis]